jgi:hypothetical protein
MKKASKNLVHHCMEAYGVNSVNKLSEITEIPYSTLNAWENDGPSKIGTLLLTALIENIEMKKNVRALIEAEDIKATALRDLKKIVG